MGRDEVTRIILDTNALIWLVNGHTNLGDEARELVDQAILRGELFVSAMSFWEVGVLVAKGRLLLYLPTSDWRRMALDHGMEEVPLTGDVAMISTSLNGLPNDPADRIIATTAMVIGGILVTSDQSLLRWEGDLQCHDARR